VKVAGINITLYKRFVDDANCKAVALEQGIVWCQQQKKLVVTDQDQSRIPADDLDFNDLMDS